MACGPPSTTRATSAEDATFVAALRQGDPVAFERLVDRHARSVRRVAAFHVASRSGQEEVVQDTWLAAWEGRDRFRGHSSVRTWVLAIARNQAITRALRERRAVPFSSVARDPGDHDDLADRLVAGAERADGSSWARAAAAAPEGHALAAELRTRLALAVALLPERQRLVLALRDVEGWSAAEVCDALGIAEGNQRVLLHRARGQMRRDLAD